VPGGGVERRRHRENNINKCDAPREQNGYLYASQNRDSDNCVVYRHTHEAQ
jgi:hypothetical protein